MTDYERGYADRMAGKSFPTGKVSDGYVAGYETASAEENEKQKDS